jgi:hypothetical protein
MRLYGQLETAHNGVPFNREFLNYDANTVTDRVCSFFIYCHHVKDWIENDDLVDPQVKKKIKRFIRKNRCLKYCADIATGIKHLKVKNKRSRTLPRIIKSQRSLVPLTMSEIKRINPLEDPPVLIKDFVYLDTDQGTIEVFDLATECVGKWRKFIEDNICKL